MTAEIAMDNVSVDEGAHIHTDKQGIIHVCYHKCRGLFSAWEFWVGQFIFWLPEHWVWDYVPPFSIIARLVGLG